MTKVKSDDWRNLPLDDWNTRTFIAYLTHLTKEKFGVTYEPTGIGSKQQRWGREMGMIKNAQNKYGNPVVKKFIELCVDKYRANPRYPYASFTFMYSYMSDQFPVAEQLVNGKAEVTKIGERSEITANKDEVKSWF